MTGASKISASESEDLVRLPGLSAGIMLGGKVNGYGRMLPGLFEEALTEFTTAPTLGVSETTDPPRVKSARASLS